MKLKTIRKILVILIIITFIILMLLEFGWLKVSVVDSQLNNSDHIATETEYKGMLQQILEKEFIINESWNCLDYAKYYNKTIKEKYPRLDVRMLRNIDLCNKLTLCDDYHVYLSINGYGSECIMDTRRLACLELLKFTKTQEELDEIQWW